MHRPTPEIEELAGEIFDYARERIRMDPPTLDGPRRPQELAEQVGRTITAEGLGGHRALRIFADQLAPATISCDHPLFLAFVPAAPTEASVLFDLVVSASSIVGSTWLEAAGAVYAENEALRWLADLAGLPDGAGGCFVSGGSAGNLSGLVAARHTAARRREADGRERPARWWVAAVDEAHSSVKSAARIMDAETLPVRADERGRLTGRALEAALDGATVEALDGLFGVVATAGTTNAGVIDDLSGVADVCRDRGLWLHVDAAYGGAGLAAPSVRARYVGIERADSLVVDPHKWMFAPFDCAALLYREPALAAAAHTQEASYLDEVNVAEGWSPTHYAFHLTRRVRGLPFWFSLAANGTDAYRDAVETVLTLTRDAADEIRRRPGLELAMEPELSVLLFRCHGWSDADYLTWCADRLREGVAFVLPTALHGERVMRFCFVNPQTTLEQVMGLLDSMASRPEA